MSDTQPEWFTAQQIAQRISPDRARRLIRQVILGGFDPSEDPHRIGVPAGQPEQIALDEHGVAAAQRLGDVPGAACGQGDVFALGHEDGGAIALETDRFTAAGVHGI